MFKLAVFLSGRGSNFLAIFDHIKKENLPIEIAIVISDKKNAEGLIKAKEYGLRTSVVQRNAAQQSLAEFNTALKIECEKYKPDLVVLAGFMRVLTKEFISAFKDKVINIHPSLLPAFPGLDVQRRAIEAGAKFSGCTVHYVVEEVDAGAIIGQAVVPILENDSEKDLAARILKQEHKLYPRVVEGIAKGKIRIVRDKVEIDSAFQNSIDNYLIGPS